MDFTYDHKHYRFQASLYETDSQRGFLSLIGKNLGEFRYINHINLLTPYGTLEYTDTEGKVDQWLELPLVYCEVVFVQKTLEQDGDIRTEKEYENNTVVMQFIVDNFEIIKNEPGKIKYKFHLKDTNWMNLSRNLNYSNYHKQKESVFTIIKNILTDKAQMNVDADTFGKSDNDKTSLKYISYNNDNCYTAIEYLLNKLYNSPSYIADENMKGLVFSERSRKMFVFDTYNVGKFQGKYDVTINQMRNSSNFPTVEPINIACVVDKTRTQMIDSIFKTIITKYDITKNEFIPHTIEPKSLINYYSGNHEDFKKLLPMKDDDMYVKQWSEWNNNIDIYNDQMSNLMYGSGLAINIVGKIGIIPGWLISITSPADLNLTVSQNVQDNQNARESFQGITGAWIVSKVISYIDPVERIFRQTICLMRSYRMIHNP